MSRCTRPTPAGTHVLALLHCDAHDAGHGLHAQALHGLAALLLAPVLLGAAALCVPMPHHQRATRAQGRRGECVSPRTQDKVPNTAQRRWGQARPLCARGHGGGRAATATHVGTGRVARAGTPAPQRTPLRPTQPHHHHHVPHYRPAGTGAGRQRTSASPPAAAAAASAFSSSGMSSSESDLAASSAGGAAAAAGTSSTTSSTVTPDMVSECVASRRR